MWQIFTCFFLASYYLFCDIRGPSYSIRTERHDETAWVCFEKKSMGQIWLNLTQNTSIGLSVMVLLWCIYIVESVIAEIVILCRISKYLINLYEICRATKGIRAMIDVTLLRDFDLYFRFQMFKICEIRSFRMLPEANTMKNIQQYTLKHLRSNTVCPVFLLRDLYLHF